MTTSCSFRHASSIPPLHWHHTALSLSFCVAYLLFSQEMMNMWDMHQWGQTNQRVSQSQGLSSSFLSIGLSWRPSSLCSPTFPNHTTSCSFSSALIDDSSTSFTSKHCIIIIILRCLSSSSLNICLPSALSALSAFPKHTTSCSFSSASMIPPFASKQLVYNTASSRPWKPEMRYSEGKGETTMSHTVKATIQKGNGWLEGATSHENENNAETECNRVEKSREERKGRAFIRAMAFSRFLWMSCVPQMNRTEERPNPRESRVRLAAEIKEGSLDKPWQHNSKREKT